MRDFVPTYEAAESDPYPPVECVACGYEFSTHREENPETGQISKVETLDRRLRDRAREAMVEEFVRGVAVNGYALRPEHRRYLGED